MILSHLRDSGVCPAVFVMRTEKGSKREVKAICGTQEAGCGAYGVTSLRGAQISLHKVVMCRIYAFLKQTIMEKGLKFPGRDKQTGKVVQCTPPVCHRE